MCYENVNYYTLKILINYCMKIKIWKNVVTRVMLSTSSSIIGEFALILIVAK